MEAAVDSQSRYHVRAWRLDKPLCDIPKAFVLERILNHKSVDISEVEDVLRITDVSWCDSERIISDATALVDTDKKRAVELVKKYRGSLDALKIKAMADNAYISTRLSIKEKNYVFDLLDAMQMTLTPFSKISYSMAEDLINSFYTAFPQIKSAAQRGVITPYSRDLEQCKANFKFLFGFIVCMLPIAFVGWVLTDAPDFVRVLGVIAVAIACLWFCRRWEIAFLKWLGRGLLSTIRVIRRLFKRLDDATKP